MHRDEHSDDDSRRRPRAPFIPPESWIEAFDAQCTNSLVKDLRRYVRLLASDVGSDYAEELVQSVLTDTMRGVLRWAPEAGDLGPYLEVVIRLRVRRDRKRARRHEHVSIDATDPDDPSSAIADVEIALAETPAGHAGDSTEIAAMSATMTRLRVHAADDPLALRFLDAAEDGAITRAEIMHLAGLASTEYHNTRRRLARLVVQLQTGRDSSTREKCP